MNTTLRVLPLALLAAACQSTASEEWRTTAAANMSVADDYEASVDAGGFIADGDVDYDSIGLEFGSTLVEPQAGRDLKREFWSVGVNLSELEEDEDLTELYAGGKFYFDKGAGLIPFLGIWGGVTDFSDADDYDPQIGARVGGGVEIPLSEDFALSAGLDYLVPIIAAEDGPVEVELEGWAVRVGLVIML